MPRQLRLTQFPQPYPDELLYSVVARYVHRAGIKNINSINSSLFGLKHNGNAIDLPSGIMMIASAIPVGQNVSAEKIVADHTLFNFHTAYSDISYRRKVYKNMLASGQPNKRIALRRKTLIAAPNYLRFCPACQSHMIETFGEAYWRRDQQLVHVVVCPTHRISLSYSQVKLQGPSSLYYRADTTSCHTDATAVIDNLLENEIDILIRIAEHSRQLSQIAQKDRTDDKIRTTYLDLLWRKGFFRNQKQINKGILGIALQKYLANFVRFWPNIGDGTSDAPNWVLSLLKKQGFNNPTFYHVLFQDFLAQQPDVKASQRRIDHKPKPKEADIQGKPWQCYNPLISDPAHANVRIVNIRYFGLDLRIRFRCSCEYEYNRRKNSDGTFKKAKLYSFGKSLIPHIARAIEEGWTLKKTARLAGLQTPTLLRQAEKLGITELPTVRRQ
ncbi:TnsD family Tn7-like transposition protein [Methylobacterium sp. OT2]|uniref:TnsD family Tn7-like transposition protein n=1 Tax=Methylobacterium sp. OT2 TaxID=2813779 RepID=UPI00197B537F|nr:TnsD family Tn7-like transposition protein [Methylobacterium sp. OT2]MBN4095979.1 TniQ family protein [Methylobacterium sp. OT2]